MKLSQVSCTQFPSLGIFVSKKKLEIEKTKATFITSVLKVVHWVVLVFSMSNFFINKKSQGRKLSEKKLFSVIQL